MDTVAPNFVEIRMAEDELKKESSAAFCEICSRTFANGNAFHLHQVKTHGLVRGEADSALLHRKRIAPEVERHYFCPVTGCQYNSGRFFHAYKLLHQHFAKVHCEKRFRCNKCKKAKFSLQRDLLYHQKKRCPMRNYSAETSTVAQVEMHRPMKVEAFSKKSPPENDNQILDLSVPQNKQAITNIFVINMNVVPASPISSYRRICPKPSPVTTKSSQTDNVEFCEKTDICHVGSQTIQRNTCEPSPPVLHEYNDFHCQTRIANGVEFGTQICLDDVISELDGKNSKTNDDDFVFEDIWRHIETQTSALTGSDALTQTAIDFMDSASMTDWDLLL